jgi:A/G-specific adenine glycosylase
MTADLRRRHPALSEPLLEWYARAKRDLPWRRARDPYAIWISETMLQQTRVETVLPYYERFLTVLPTLQSLADAKDDVVLGLWSGLGYYRRARMLHAAARAVVADYGGSIPSDAEGLQRLPGIGRYTAGAVASIAFGRSAAVVDGNVARVLSRIFAVEEDVKSAAGAARIWQIAETLLQGLEADPGDWNQALMELGATVCLPRAPRCGDCPVVGQCVAKERGIEASLPRSRAKERPATVRRSAIVLASGDRVLLARRRSHLLFGGLWEPPSANGGVRPLATRLDVDAAILESMGKVVHLLSHRRMSVRVFRSTVARAKKHVVPTREYDAIDWISSSDLSGVPHASLTRKILELAKLSSRGLRSGQE